MPLHEIGGEIASQPLNENFEYLEQRITTHESKGAADDVHGLLSGGKIIEEAGSNANGYYIRFADGTQVCYHGMNASRFNGGEMRATWTFPAIFISRPHVVGNRASVGSITPSEDMIGQTRLSISTERCITSVFRISGANDWSTNDSFIIDFAAFGRWK